MGRTRERTMPGYRRMLCRVAALQTPKWGAASASWNQIDRPVHDQIENFAKISSFFGYLYDAILP
jgi:hypothetical protein